MKKTSLLPIIILVIILMPITVKASSVNIEQQINNTRKLIGLKELVTDKKLINTSKFKVNDMIYHKYFNHYNKFGDGVLDIFKRFNIKFNYCGEILAKGYQENELLNAWMESPTHKSVILDDYNKIGCYEKNLISVCHFSD